MKLRAFIYSILAVFLFCGCAFGQTAITDNGSVDNTDTYYKVVTYSGTISGTDTLLLNSISVAGVNNVFDFQYKLTSAADSAKVTIKRQSNYIGTYWSDVTTIAASDSLLTQKAIADTLGHYPSGIRPVIIGTSGNGYLTGFQLRLVFKRE